MLGSGQETADAINGVLAAGTLILLGLVIQRLLARRGIPDAAAGDELLRQVAALLGGRFQDRQEVPWYRRPHRYGQVEGRLGGSSYRLMILPAGSESDPGCAMLQLGRRPETGHERVVFVPERVWHWPDRADPEVLADYVRRATSGLL